MQGMPCLAIGVSGEDGRREAGAAEGGGEVRGIGEDVRRPREIRELAFDREEARVLVAELEDVPYLNGLAEP